MLGVYFERDSVICKVDGFSPRQFQPQDLGLMRKDDLLCGFSDVDVCISN